METFATDRTKVCSSCKTEKPLDDFYPRHDGKEGVRYRCKICNKTSKDKNRDYSRKYLFKNRYNITEEQYELKAAQQDNRCAICGARVKLHVDHDHNTGAFRGLLCPNCNKAIGLFKDNPDTLRSAAEYLEDVVTNAG